MKKILSRGFDPIREAESRDGAPKSWLCSFVVVLLLALRIDLDASFGRCNH